MNKIKVMKIRFKNFKGMKDGEICLNDFAQITGKNGSNKTTIADGHMWLWCNKSYDLENNPPVMPFCMEQGEVTVEEELDVDGKTVNIGRIQKTSIKREKTTSTNKYVVNGVEMGDKAFRDKLNEIGIDCSLFLLLSHTESFLEMNGKDMRTALYKMSDSDVSGEYLAKELGYEGLAKQLTSFTMDEVEAMARRKLKDIDKEYGKGGEILNARIRTLEDSKAEGNIEELLTKKKDLERQIEEFKSSDKSDEISDLEKAIDSKESEIESYKEKIIDSRKEQSYMIAGRLSELRIELMSLNNEANDGNRYNNELDSEIKQLEQKRDELINSYTAEKKKKFDASQFENNHISETCPFCGQKLPQEKIDELNAKNEAEKLKAEKTFIEEKKQRLDQLSKDGMKNKYLLEKYQHYKKVDTKQLEDNMVLIRQNIDDLENSKKALEADYDFGADVEYKRLVEENSKLHEQLQLLSNGNDNDNEFTVIAGIASLSTSMKLVDEKITLMRHNDEIDEKIRELRDKQKEYEQAIADNEMILDQVKDCRMKKNEKMEGSINANFDTVKWQLFRTQRNGEIVECCIPLFDGKPYGIGTNKALEQIGKIEILEVLQDFYRMYFPIFIDNAELFDSNSMNNIKNSEHKTQFVFLSVSDEDLQIK